MNKPLWVLHICGKMSVGGVQSVLMNYYKYIDRNKIQFAFAVQRNYSYDYDDFIYSLGGRIHFLPDMIDDYAGFKRKLYDLLKEHPEYNIVQCHYNFRNWRMLGIAKKAGVPIRISHAHAANSKDRLSTKLHLGIQARLIRYFATCCVSCSIVSGKYLYETSNFEIIHNALELQKFKYNGELRKKKRRELKLDNNKIALFEIGHLVENKNQEFAIEILKHLDMQYVLYLVGVGEEYKRKLCQKINELSLENRVFFLGERSDVGELMQAFDIMVFPSKHEGLSVVCMEAQAAGVPIITSNCVPTEIDVTGLVKFLPLENVYEWSEAISSIDISGREDSTDMLKKAGYDIRNESRKLEKLYLKLNEEMFYDK